MTVSTLKRCYFRKNFLPLSGGEPCVRRSRSLREYTTRIVCLSEQQMDTADSEKDIIQMGTERVGDDSKRTASYLPRR